MFKKKIIMFLNIIHEAWITASASISGLVGTVTQYFIANVYKIKTSWNLALLLLSLILLCGILIPGVFRIIFLLISFASIYYFNIYEKYVHFILGLTLELLLDESAGGEDYESHLYFNFFDLLTKVYNLNLNLLDCKCYAKNTINDLFCYIHRIIIIFIIFVNSNRILYFIGYSLLIGYLLFYNLSFYLPIFTIWVVIANFIFFYFDCTYTGFINNLGKYNPEIADQKLALTKLNIITVQHWIIRGFSPCGPYYNDKGVREDYCFLDNERIKLYGGSMQAYHLGYHYPHSYSIIKLYKEREPYFNPRFKYSEYPDHPPEYIGPGSYIPLSFKNKPLPGYLFAVTPFYTKIFTKAKSTTPNNDLVKDHYGVKTTSLKDNVINYNVATSNDIGEIRPHANQIEIGSYYKNLSKRTFLNRLGIEDRVNGSFYSQGFDYSINKDVGKHIQNLHPENYPTLKHGIPIQELNTLYKRNLGLQKAMQDWHDHKLPKEFCKDYPPEFGDLIRIIGYSRGNYSLIEPYINHALKISDQIVKSYPRNSSGYNIAIEIRGKLENLDLNLQPMKLAQKELVINSMVPGKSFSTVIQELGVYV
jgi:hypothetical protein